ADITDITYLYSNVTIPNHIQQQLLDGEKYVPTSFQDSPIGISIVSDPIAFTHCTPCYTTTHDPPFDLSTEILDNSLIDYMLSIDNHSDVDIDSSSSQITIIGLSHDSLSSDIASHETSHTSSHTPSYYVDDPID
ncbi:hypothetical protein KI387_035172, partial [Taxus chinensis]